MLITSRFNSDPVYWSRGRIFYFTTPEWNPAARSKRATGKSINSGGRRQRQNTGIGASYRLAYSSGKYFALLHYGSDFYQ